MSRRLQEHRREAEKAEHLHQGALYKRIRETGGWDTVTVAIMNDVSGQAMRDLEAALLAEHISDPDCLNSKLERSNNPAAVRMRAYYERNREKWNAYNRKKQAEYRYDFSNA